MNPMITRFLVLAALALATLSMQMQGDAVAASGSPFDRPSSAFAPR